VPGLRPTLLVLAHAAAVAMAVAAPASARWYGSTMQGAANATYGRCT
jgi:hypothetical protein